MTADPFLFWVSILSYRYALENLLNTHTNTQNTAIALHFYNHELPEQRISKQLTYHKLINTTRTAARMPPNSASEAWGSIQLCSLQGDSYTLYLSNVTASTWLMPKFSCINCNLTQRFTIFFSLARCRENLFIFPACFLNREYKFVQSGEKKEEKYFTAMQPPSVPCGRDGMSRAQEAMKEEVHY